MLGDDRGWSAIKDGTLNLSYKNQTIAAQMIVVSDMHLEDSVGTKAKAFFRLIDSLDKKTLEYFVLNGDIFDFCLGNHPYFQKKFRAIGSALTKLAHSGVTVVYIQGNHEFSHKDLGWEGVQFVSKATFQASLKSGVKLAFTHGDNFNAKWHYLIYKQLINLPITLSIASLVPGKLLDQLSLFLAQLSRKNSSNQLLRKEPVLTAANAWLDKTGAQHGVFGHFHTPLSEKRWTKVGQLLSLSSWDEVPNFLSFAQGSFSRVHIDSCGFNEV